MKIKNILQLVVFIIISELAGIVGSIFTAGSIPGWYATVNRPDIAPPNWIFGPVWTTLFLLMGIASYIIWKKGYERKDVRLALEVFATQLVLNVIWSIIFFGQHNIGLALIEILILWVAILFTIISFYKISKPAAYLLIPYILWVSFATYLNYSFWMIN